MAGKAALNEYPAYARTIAAHLARGEKPIAVSVVLSNRWWNLLDHVPRICVRADDWTLGRYEWSYLRGLHVVAFLGDGEEKHFGELLLELMGAGPSMLWAYDMSGNALSADDTPYARSMAHWAAHMAGRTANDPLVDRARVRYADAISRAAAREIEEYERIRARSGDDAAVLWSAARMGWPDLVRKRFVAPLQAAGEPLPA